MVKRIGGKNVLLASYDRTACLGRNSQAECLTRVRKRSATWKENIRKPDHCVNYGLHCLSCVLMIFKSAATAVIGRSLVPTGPRPHVMLRVIRNTCLVQRSGYGSLLLHLQVMR